MVIWHLNLLVLLVAINGVDGVPRSVRKFPSYDSCNVILELGDHHTSLAS